MVDIAQLVSASDCGSEGRGFESHYPPQKKRIPFGILFLFCANGIRTIKCSCPVDSCWPGRAPATPYDVFPTGNTSAPNPIIHPIKKNRYLLVSVLFKLQLMNECILGGMHFFCNLGMTRKQIKKQHYAIYLFRADTFWRFLKFPETFDLYWYSIKNFKPQD